MVSIKSVLVSALAVATVWAVDNSIISPGWGQVANADDTLKITWNPTTSGNVNLILRQGGAQDLTVLYTIAGNIENTGSYTWSIPAKTGSNTDYSIEIAPVDNTNDSNFSPYFTILAVGQGITSSSSVTGSATTTGTTASATDSSATDSATDSATTTSGSVSSSESASTSASTFASTSASSSESTATTGSSLTTKASSTTSESTSSASETTASETSSAETSSATTTTATTTAATGGAVAQPANAAIALGAALGAVILGTL